MTWGFIVHMVLAGLFTFGFLRAAGVRFQAACIGAVAYLLSGAMASYASPGHDGKLFVSSLLPAALWALTLGMRDGRRAAWGALAVVVGLAVLSPHPQLLQYMLLISGAYALWLALKPQAVITDSGPVADPPAFSSTAVGARCRGAGRHHGCGAVPAGSRVRLLVTARRWQGVRLCHQLLVPSRGNDQHVPPQFSGILTTTGDAMASISTVSTSAPVSWSSRCWPLAEAYSTGIAPMPGSGWAR